MAEIQYYHLTELLFSEFFIAFYYMVKIVEKRQKKICIFKWFWIILQEDVHPLADYTLEP